MTMLFLKAVILSVLLATGFAAKRNVPKKLNDNQGLRVTVSLETVWDFEMIALDDQTSLYWRLGHAIGSDISIEPARVEAYSINSDADAMKSEVEFIIAPLRPDGGWSEEDITPSEAYANLMTQYETKEFLKSWPEFVADFSVVPSYEIVDLVYCADHDWRLPEAECEPFEESTTAALEQTEDLASNNDDEKSEFEVPVDGTEKVGVVESTESAEGSEEEHTTEKNDEESSLEEELADEENSEELTETEAEEETEVETEAEDELAEEEAEDELAEEEAEDELAEEEAEDELVEEELADEEAAAEEERNAEREAEAEEERAEEEAEAEAKAELAQEEAETETEESETTPADDNEGDSNEEDEEDESTTDNGDAEDEDGDDDVAEDASFDASSERNIAKTASNEIDVSSTAIAVGLISFFGLVGYVVVQTIRRRPRFTSI